jgi:hypothetical protein
MSRYPRIEYKYVNYRLEKKTVERIEEITRYTGKDSGDCIKRAIDDLLYKLAEEEREKDSKKLPKQLTFILPGT